MSASTSQSAQPVSNHVEEPLSPGMEGSSSASSVVQGGSCSQTFVGSSFEGDAVSSSCDRTPGVLNIPSSQDSPGSVGQSTLGISPRSPPFVSHLPDILEGDWEPAENGVVTVAQSVEARPQSQSFNLPKIDVHKRDVENWVNEVHRRMSQTSCRSSEGSHLELGGNASRRSSQESGWSSYGSRRSSQASPFPTTNIQPQEVIPHFPNGYSVPLVPKGMTPPHRRPHLHPLDGNDDTLRRTSETSTCSNQSAPHNRLSRNSSGYGSQSNLAVIRSPMFHKIQPSSHLLTQRITSTCADATNRRKSDTVICEADSSGSYLPKPGKGEQRRSSEPIRQARVPVARLESQSVPLNRQATPMPNVNETELICGDLDPQEFDAYLNPQEEKNFEPTPHLHPPPGSQNIRQTRRLCHYPYTEEEQTAQQAQRQQPSSLQTVHHRPQSLLPSPPNPSIQQDPRPCDLGKPQEGHWPSPRYRTGQQFSATEVHNGLYPPSEHVTFDTAMQTSSQRNQFDMGNYEDLMVSGIGSLSTDNGGVSDFVGNGNMVVNDMNTLLNSLREEERYLEMCQNSRGQVAGSAMSIF